MGTLNQESLVSNALKVVAISKPERFCSLQDTLVHLAI